MKAIANGIWRITIGEPETWNPTSIRKFPVKNEALEKLKKRKIKPEVMEQMQWETSIRGITITLPMEASEDIYGFGLQLKSINHAGRKRIIKVNSDPPSDTGESHAPVPFYISTAGYGLFVDSFRYISFYMGTVAEKGSSKHMQQENIEHKEFSESALYALKRAKEKRKIIIEIPRVKGVDIYFFTGDIKEVVQRYNLFSGGGCLPPMWGLGMWYRTYGGSSQDTVLELARLFREEHMPMDVLGLEPGWHSHSYSCSYKWSYLFEKPQQMIQQLEQKGYKLNLWEHSYVYPTAPFYEQIMKYSGECEVWNGLVPDFATKEACSIFAQYHQKEFVKLGIKGFKLDECDNSDYNPSDWSFPDSTKFPSNMDGEQMHMAIGILYQNLLYRVFKNELVRTFSQVRSSGALAAPLPFVLYSDLYDHKQFIRGMVTSGFSGLLWAPEVRDCLNENDLLRRLQTIVFSEQALINSWRIPSPPWKQVDIEKNLAGEWMEEATYYTNACRKYFEIRMQLLPYLYSAFVEYYQNGTPPIRALVMDYSNDEQVRNIDDEYMFGKSLLVCPLTIEDKITRQIYLPEGVWYHFFTGEVIQGGKSITIKADYDQIPVYVRENTIIPIAKPVLYVSKDTVFEIKVKEFGTGETQFTLYEDDYETFSYEKGNMNEVILQRDARGNISYIRKGCQKERYKIQCSVKESSKRQEI
ncbi:alpha-D-xyloside xylohydrolase [Lachnotalea glycerini]|uniref:Alpha-D-xyloside xylohydrolase n=1 Tax=Lachnotalea glycerini TaxID=1763509 RepID=A0A318EJA0_9FIRM|nr:TIM-barrel domain-containing protein [Lachnotalea glycerini]PXV87768.1 alpha-D-xyloside xylohydrolase [Lachnotalea glycerini]